MAADSDPAPIYASTLLWGVILLATAAVVLTRGVWAGAAVFASAAAGVLVVAVVLVLRQRAGHGPQYDNKLDPWDG